MSQKIKQTAVLVLTAVWMFVIFQFSANPVEESLQTSDRLVKQIIRIFVPDFNGLSPERQESIAHTLSMVVRKGAHMTEYAVLTVLLFTALSQWHLPLERFRRAAIAWGGATLYAVTDELHQRFVPGRSGVPTDVLIDSIGAIIGGLIAVGVAYLLARRKLRKAVS